jgi:serine/threonine-protein kinase
MPLELKPGDVYGNFRIERVLRKYPQAWVYQVRAPAFAEPVDLKVSLHPVVSEDAARRALREIAVLGRLSNRHVVKVHDSGLGPNEHWYILMEHLEGAQLHHWHDFDVPLPTTDAVTFIHHACLGLAEIHAEGIVHRALEPSRLWVEPDRTLKIMDFGFARSWGAEATGDNVTTGHPVLVAPQYGAPEQGTSTELTPAADVYALGMILYEMLTAHSPFFPTKSWSRARADLVDDPGGWLRAHVKTEPTPLGRHPAAAGAPAKLVELVHRCLAKDPGARPKDGAELANQLGWILHHDLGAAQAAVLTSRTGDAPPRFHLIVPGSHRLSLRGSPLEQKEEKASAVLEWDGGSKLADLVPEGTTDVWVDGAAITGRTALRAGASIRVGRSEVSLVYPKRP